MLAHLELGSLLPRFVENFVDDEALVALEPEDFRELGVELAPALAIKDRDYLMQDVQEAETLLMEALQASRQAFGAGHDQTARVRQELDAVRAARRGDEVDGSKLERGPIVLDKPDDGDEKTIDSID